MSVITVFDAIGAENRSNTVAYLPCQHLPSESDQKCIIFFPGDIQNFVSEMEKHHSCKDYIGWSYESTMSLLSDMFPSSNILLVVPSRQAYNSICNYKNFVKSESLFGIPSYSTEFNGLSHLEKLICNAASRVNPAINNSLLVLIGFSKGCVVLNQCLYELSVLNREAKASAEFVKRIACITWLDGGHSGENDVWITDHDVIAGLQNEQCCHIMYSIHVTPYQVKDDSRPWKGEEFVNFLQLLSQFQINFNHKLYFEDEKPSIEKHFQILSAFDSSLMTS